MDVIDFLIFYWQKLVLAALLFAGLAMFWHKNREAIGLFWLGIRHRFFLFGKLRRLAKNTEHNNHWFHSETVVCQDYKPYYQNINKSPAYYVKCKEYLEIVGEAGRKPLTIPLIAILFTVLVLEAWGFSYTMSGFLDISASENTRKIMAWILSLTFAVTLATVTHKMGHEIHRNKIISNVRDLWAADPEPAKALTQQAGARVGAIENPSDENEKPYVKRLNRLELGKSHPTYFWTISSVAVIIVIASILTFIRVKAFEQAQTQDSMCNVSSVTEPSSSAGEPNFDDLYPGSSPSNEVVPNVVIEHNNSVVNEGRSDRCAATEAGSWATFCLLAILFCALQTFATWASTARGFAGALSHEAHETIKGHSTVDEFATYYDNKKREIVDLAQKSLVKLQSLMAIRIQKVASNATVTKLAETAGERNFYAFLEEEHRKRLTTTIKLKQDELESQHFNQKLEASSKVEAAKTSAILTDNLAEIESAEEAKKAAIKAQFAKLTAAKETIETEEQQNNRLISEFENETGHKLTDEERKQMLQSIKDGAFA
ncbi:hypothetical protein [Agarivorans gilvus]|uniref:MotA/TolQ/ExbB proton channel domain-containing protein n=1 Tax=Agarivorans gilvus TaxID=680279 RepID=A0ABQ1I283_9ALTE|nr:hypothetical protein [Agarivorans gilvus]GGB05421.1 hypothetical protein GCM10007414_18440 [Agarivorans gilvus]